MNILDEYKESTASKVEMITDVIPKGTTVFYGASGVGKTYSIIKNLNQYDIKPILLDFDNNVLADELECDLIKGSWYFNRQDEILKKCLGNKRKLLYKIENIMNNMMGRYYKENKIYHYNRLKENDFKSFIEEHYYHLDRDEQLLLDELANDYDNKFTPTDEYFYGFTNSVIIIDTYAYSLSYINDFEFFVNELISLGNSVVVVAHEQGERGSEPETPTKFTNHCQAKLRLRQSLTKTKGTENYLTVEKLRGYSGNKIVNGWMR